MKAFIEFYFSSKILFHDKFLINSSKIKITIITDVFLFHIISLLNVIQFDLIL